ncbi:hypothetical protein [Ectobacillus ponti]|uniref:Uncharacterized protein n=1 Tax=Ectobacillus ponti TaxID=2961894 RepID=A0AA42BTP9_9BACI|nr:hypothetical protein [Ectobacillus ponti]MCP8969703.1 hypothetical protein [Ectobacillus ponti]
MHPKKIVDGVAELGAVLTVEGNDLYVENPEKIYPEVEELIKAYKPRVITYLKGEYSAQQQAIDQTIEKILACFLGEPQDVNGKIQDWLKKDEASADLFLQLFVEWRKNGWMQVREPTANYENHITQELSKIIFNNAMRHFKGG